MPPTTDVCTYCGGPSPPPGSLSGMVAGTAVVVEPPQRDRVRGHRRASSLLTMRRRVVAPSEVSCLETSSRAMLNTDEVFAWVPAAATDEVVRSPGGRPATRGRAASAAIQQNVDENKHSCWGYSQGGTGCQQVGEGAALGVEEVLAVRAIAMDARGIPASTSATGGAPA